MAQQSTGFAKLEGERVSYDLNKAAFGELASNVRVESHGNRSPNLA